ncbi:alkaline phosphatase D family protein [Variovorax sp. J22R133]|uniref:alkaline phosphatase D family protein n=1 Tax=Variovorax brevis TaxID=3053503 RepID=UPI0025785655|nr:alkaline phosphatase D family protein [Variovorax sp. J22R133]MDM0117881.1 alkaline phosphatase D family protein [Variovorax sp. J22R133]
MSTFPGTRSSIAPEDAGPSRRSLIRGAVYYAMLVVAGVSTTGCGGGGHDADAGGGSSGTGSPGDPGSTTAFKHGVASGDPLSDRVILWTRVTVASPGTLNLSWQIASDANFGIIVARGVATTGPERDYTVKVDATGLQPAGVYYYRFYLGSDTSPTGRTKTLPTGNVSQVRMALLSCANFPAGYFNVYAEVAKRIDIDVALHVGDYIYEYGLEGFLGQLAISPDRRSEPSHETVSLDDYRIRHAQTRTDADLKAMHGNVPVIAVWDDHELADNAWLGGAKNHDPSTEGSFTARRDAAVQAYHEWMPTRVPDPADPLKIYRSFDFGNLVSLHMLDTRLVGRDQQVSLDAYLQGAADSPTRQILGSVQFDWLSARMAASSATWQVLGQQVLMARMEVPLTVASSMTPVTLADYLLALSTPDRLRSNSQRDLVNQRRAPYNLDAWDGYPAAREAVLNAARSQGKNLVSLAGDTHNSWGSNLTDTTGQRVGVEFGGSSVSSPGFETSLPLISNSLLADAFLKMVADLRYAETSKRGYMVITLTAAEARGDWVEISTVFSRSYTTRIAGSMHASPGPGNLDLVPV